MQDLDKFLDKLHYDGTREYTRTEGNIDYLDGIRLNRPADMPGVQRIFVVVLVIIGIIIGCFIVNDTVISRMRAAASAEQAIADNLAREASIETIPHMVDLINLDDEGIRRVFQEAGYNIYDATDASDPGEMTLYKIPADMTSAEAALLYTKGVGSLDVADATKLLNGSWYFSADRINTTSMVVRYADFSTGDPQIAVQNAFQKEGFDPTSITESGVDEADNTFSSGTLTAGETSCTWKISALQLDDMYSISGLPEDACYVGIRLTIV